MFEDDYVMRIIYEMIRTALKLLFNIDKKKFEEVHITDKMVEQKKKYLYPI